LLIQAVLFDLDGTLLNTLQDLADACNQALEASGLGALPTESYRFLVGSGTRVLVSRAAAESVRRDPEGISLADLPEDYAGRLLADFRTAYDRNWHDQTKPYSGIEQMLSDLRGIGVRLAVLSNKPDDFTKKMVSRFFPAGWFENVSGQVDDWPVKPDPALALDISRRLHVDPGEAAILGDSGSDMETAVRGGFIAAGALWGFRTRAELASQGARFLFNDPDQFRLFVIAQNKAGVRT
jgi:phosphoglycolate phosphatase